MTAHACLKNEFTADEKCHNLMSWLILCLDCGFLNVRVNLFFTSLYKGVYLKAESANKNIEYAYPECRSNLTL